MESLDLICPAIARDADRFRILLESYQALWRAPGKFYVFTPDKDVELFKGIVEAAGDLRVSVRSKRSVIGDLPYEWNVPGWFRQQMLKLGAARAVSSRVYCAIDSDCFLAQPLTSEFLAEGIPWTSVEFSSTRNVVYTLSAAALGMQDADALPARAAMWQPPFFFDVGVVDAALNRMEVEHALSWVEVLARTRVWGEARVYHLMVHALGLQDDHKDGLLRTHEPIRYPHVDIEGDFEKWDLDETFGGRYAFGVIHSNAKIEPARVRARIGDRFEEAKGVNNAD